MPRISVSVMSPNEVAATVDAEFDAILLCRSCSDLRLRSAAAPGWIRRRGVIDVSTGSFIRDARAVEGAPPRLTARQREIATLIAGGLSNKEIAHRLQLSVSTVKNHVHRMLSATSLPTRAALTASLVGSLTPASRAAALADEEEPQHAEAEPRRPRPRDPHRRDLVVEAADD